MPHSTIENLPLRRDLSTNRGQYKLPQEMRTSLEKFPDHNDDFAFPTGKIDSRTPTPKTNGTSTWLPPNQERAMMWSARGSRGHGRQKSLSDALKTIRTRRGSVSQNAHEIADALKAPVSPRLIVRMSCPSVKVFC